MLKYASIKSLCGYVGIVCSPYGSTMWISPRYSKILRSALARSTTCAERFPSFSGLRGGGDRFSELSF